MKKLLAYTICACASLCAAASEMKTSAETATEPANAPLAPDANLRIETLENGFTIAVYPNSEPPGRVSMRLLVRRGSAAEADGQEGIAHFVEHMAFNGTKNFPKGEMVEYFQRLGMAFGADTNAHTGFSETVYKIDMPSNARAMTLDGLRLLGDYAGAILFGESEIERERGVILAEKKSRDTSGYRLSVGLIKSLFKGSVYERRMPIGLEEVIKNAPKSEFEKFYRANYRPENMALVVAGDVDPAGIFAEARPIFSALSADASSEARAMGPERFNAAGGGAPQVWHVEDGDARDCSAGIYLVGPVAYPEDGLQKRIRDMRFSAMAKAATLRFDARKSSPESRFSAAYADFGSFENYAEVFTIGARANVSNAPAMAEEAARMYRGLVKNGFGEWELEKAESEILNSLESQVRGKPTRQSASLADAITSALSAGETVTDPESDLEIAREAFRDFTAADASEMFRKFASGARLFARTVDVPSSGGGAVADGFRSLIESDSPAGLYGPLAAEPLKFANFGAARGPVSTEDGGLGISMLKFANGVRANLKKTDFARGEVVVNISFGGGRYDLPREKPALAGIAAGMLLGGTEMQSYDEINVAKSDMQISLNFTAEGDAFSFSCSTTTESLRSALALMATYMRAPAFRESATSYVKKIIAARYRQVETNPEAALVRVDGWLTDGNYMLAFPPRPEADALTMGDLGAWLGPIMASSYMEISIAGDFDEAEAAGWLGEFFGSMPGRAAERPDYSDKRRITFTSEMEKTFFVKNSADERSIAMRVWPTCDRRDIRKMRAANILGAVLSDALRKSVREREGKVYSPFAYNNSSQAFNFGILSAVSDVAPSMNSEVSELMAEAARAKSEEISEDEFVRAKAPIIKQVEKTRRLNSYWANYVMPLYQADPLRREIAKTFETGYSEITISDVRAAAAEYLKGRDGYAVGIMPSKSE